MGRVYPKRACGVCGETRRIHLRARDGQPDMCQRCAPSTTACGICGAVGRIAVSATADRPAIGNCCYEPPVATCSRCGRERPCYHADTDAPVCLSCANRRFGECGTCGRVTRLVRKGGAGSPALGICCYEPPRATCSDCGEERPCRGAKTSDPVCERCTRVRRAPVCVGCGQRRVTYRRIERGVLCQSCNVKEGHTTCPCADCGQTAPLTGGACAACRLRSQVAQLGDNATIEVARTLAPFLRDLARAENPDSRLRWFFTPGFAVTRRMLDGEIPISHQGLDDAAHEAASAVGFLRAKLVEVGVLEPRDEASARFAAWHATAVLQIPAGPDRAHVRAFATWHVGHQLARTVTRRGEASRSSIKYARSLVTEAIKLTVWLHDQHVVELADLRQDLVDEWLVAGSLVRRRVRMFLAWLRRASVTGVLDVAWDDRAAARTAISDDDRFAILRTLLHDETVDLTDRFVGSVLLLYGQPITRIATLVVGDVDIARDGAITLRLGRGLTVLPDPLAQIASRLSNRRLAQARPDGWLLPGRHAGQHITAEALGRRLKRYGVDRSREGRHAALLALAARLPAPVLAERLGIHQSRAAAWVRMAGDTYVGYVAIRTRDEPARMR